MGVAYNVNTALDITLGANTHTLWVTVVPAPTPSTPTFSIEMITTQMWTAGYLLGKNKFTTTVKVSNFPVCQEGHDIGPLIPDVTIPFVNVYYAIMWPFSERKMSFAASTVKFDKKAVACADITMCLPMMTCGDPITAPLAFPLTNWLHRVKVGMTPGDFIMGWVNIGVSIAIDVVFEFLPDGPAGVGDEVGEAILGKMGLTPKSFAKKATSSLAGLITGAVGHAIDPNQPEPSYSISVGAPHANIGLQLDNDPNTSVISTPSISDPLNIF